jgi:hypothetical protein
MLTSTISETKDHLSELLEKVQNGEVLIILDRKTPVARVERISTMKTSNPHLIPPKIGGISLEALDLPIGGKKGNVSGVLSALLEERESGR